MFSELLCGVLDLVVKYLFVVFFYRRCDERYRKNAATREAGALTFEDLFPGTFYLKPLLKVSQFRPIKVVCYLLTTADRYEFVPLLSLSGGIKKIRYDCREGLSDI